MAHLPGSGANGAGLRRRKRQNTRQKTAPGAGWAQDVLETPRPEPRSVAQNPTPLLKLFLVDLTAREALLQDVQRRLA